MCLSSHCCELCVIPAAKVCRRAYLQKVCIKGSKHLWERASCASWFYSETVWTPRGPSLCGREGGQWDWASVSPSLFSPVPWCFHVLQLSDFVLLWVFFPPLCQSLEFSPVTCFCLFVCQLNHSPSSLSFFSDTVTGLLNKNHLE